MKTLDRTAMVDLLTGCALFGTGGGGELLAGIRYVDMAIAAGKQFKLASLDEIDGNALFCSPYALGCTVPSSRPPSQRHLPSSSRPPILLALETLGNRIGKPFNGAISCELGAENTAVAAYAAAMMDGFLIDGDAAGRAVPEITHSTFYLNNLPVSPMIMANQFGETVTCENVYDDQRAEEIARQFAKISCDDIVAADHPLTADQLCGNIIEGTLSQAMEVGRLLNDESLEIDEACNRIIMSCNGRQLMRGEVFAVNDRIEDGFTIGQISLIGVGEFDGRKCVVDFKNENMRADLDNELVVTIPDLVCAVNNKTRQPVTNPNCCVGDSLTVLILPAPEPFTTETGLAVFGPSYIGISEPFRPYCSEE